MKNLLVLLLLIGCGTDADTEPISARISLDSIFYENHGLFTVHNATSNIPNPIWVDYQPNIDSDPGIEGLIETDTISVVIEEVNSPHYRIIELN